MTDDDLDRRGNARWLRDRAEPAQREEARAGALAADSIRAWAEVAALRARVAALETALRTIVDGVERRIAWAVCPICNHRPRVDEMHAQGCPVVRAAAVLRGEP